MRRLIVLLALAGLFVMTASASVITTYTDRTAWEAAVGLWYTEPFDSTGLVIAGVNTSAGAIGSTRGVLTGSVWNDRVSLSGGELTTFWYLTGPVYGAGADFDTSPGGEGQALMISLSLSGGGSQIVGQVGPLDGGFFGWTSSAPFDSFTIGAGIGGGTAETFDMDNLSFATPEPATFGILGAGLIALGFFRKKLK